MNFVCQTIQMLPDVLTSSLGSFFIAGLSHPVESETGDIIFHIILYGLIIVLGITVGVFWYRQNIFARQIEHMKFEIDRRSQKPAAKMDEIEINHVDVMRELAHSVNEMITHMQDQVASEQFQRRELETILSNMVQGVIVIDLDEKILSLNDAACRLLGVHMDEAIGKGIAEMVRNRSLQRLITRSITETQVEEEITLRHDNLSVDSSDRYLHAHGSSLKNARGDALGGLVVLNDVSQMKRAESVRRDFVANVSHELKTPVAAIKGSAETVLDALPDDIEAADRFVRTIVRQADRLHAIIEDLLSLARIEQSAGSNIPFEPGNIRDVCSHAIESCMHQAEPANVEIVNQCCTDHMMLFNRALLEQAIINLIDNAVKYAGEDTTVTVSCALDQSERKFIISVEDNGIGISPVHQQRIFERFYRPDKARSRGKGGTGLGLAIVKHVAQAHGGQATLKSNPGEGSLFQLHLPNRSVESPESTEVTGIA